MLQEQGGSQSFLGRILGDHIFSQVPGFIPLRTIARQFADLDQREGFKSCLVDVEDGSLAPVSPWSECTAREV